MKLSLSTFQLYLLYSTPLAYSLHGQRTPPAVAQDPFVQEVIAGLSYIIKLPCINCPYHPDPQGDWEGPPEPNCLVGSSPPHSEQIRFSF